MEEWMTVIQNAISDGLNAQLSGNTSGSTEPDPEQLRVMGILTAKEGNDVCADCNCQNPDWASINLGILLCLDCSGVHRRLGVHISKVRSAILDVKQWTPELLDVFSGLGNTTVNSLTEANLGETQKPTSASPREVKETFIRAKYETRSFVSLDRLAPPPPEGALRALPEGGAVSVDDEPESEAVMGRALMKAVISGDLVACLGIIVRCGGGIVDWRDPDQGMLSALHCAAAAGHKCVIELLLLNGGDINVQGGLKDLSPLHLAVTCKKVAACELLVSKGALVGLQDSTVCVCAQPVPMLCHDMTGARRQ
jgi:hypothetical protein